MDLRTQASALRVTHRFSALLVVLLWCAAPVLAGIHADAEVHRYCAEHGALEDAGETPASSAAAHSAVPDGAVQGRSEPPAPHDGCVFGEYCRFGQRFERIVLGFAGDLAFSPATVPGVPPAAAPIAILVVAPKTSPPVAS